MPPWRIGYHFTMICPSCGSDNADEQTHCVQCAAALRSAEDEILTNKELFGEEVAAVDDGGPHDVHSSEMTFRFTGLDGRERTYRSLEEMPAGVRRFYEQTVLPQVERLRESSQPQVSRRVTHRIVDTSVRSGGRSRRTIRVDDGSGPRTFHSVDEMPPGIRAFYESVSAFGRRDAGGSAARDRPAVSPPKGITVEPAGDALRITRRWYRLSTVLLFLGLAPLFLWVGTLRVGADLPSLLAPLINLLPTLLGLLFAYTLLMFLFNRTVIEIADERVSFSHGPLPWFPGRSFNAGELEQLFCEEHINRLSRGAPDYDYELKALTTDGRTLCLLSDIPDAEQAWFLEEQIERRLGITDRPVPGEHAH
jgi:hypothetical protein